MTKHEKFTKELYKRLEESGVYFRSLEIPSNETRYRNIILKEYNFSITGG